MKSKYYIMNEISKYKIFNIKEGDIIYFEMPPMCSGEYFVRVYKDEYGYYITETPYFERCVDFRLNRPYWG